MTSSAPLVSQSPPGHLSDGHAPSLAERLIRALEAHLAAGAYDIADCQELVRASQHPVMHLLLDLIVDDEQRQHVLLRRLLERLQEAVAVSTPTSPPLPVPSDAPFVADDAAVARLRALIRDEEEGARYLRHLARQEPILYDGLFGVLMETIARDSQKHANLLRYLVRRVEVR